MRFLFQQYRDLRTNWEPSGLGYEVWRTSGAFLILIFLGYLPCSIFPNLLDTVMDTIQTMFAAADVYTEDGGISAVALFSNNVSACFMTVLYGLVPFLTLPAFSLGLNAMLLGVVAAYYVSEGQSLVLYLAGILPHGIFELPALVLSIACGLLLCSRNSRRLKAKQDTQTTSGGLSQVAQVFLLLILPLLALAALAEAYLTPWVMGLFS